jgi:transposase
VVDLLCTGESGVPLFLRVADGNEADQAVFASLLKDLRARIDLDALFVADSALYGAQNLSLLGTLRWLCRVPRTLEQARRVLAQTPREAFVQSDLHEGYLITELENEYGGIKQRWLVVHSAELEKAAGERLHRRLERRERELDRELSRRVARLSLAERTPAKPPRRSPPKISASTTGSPIRRSLRWLVTAREDARPKGPSPRRFATV